MNAIEVKNITKSYKDFTLDNISFSLPKGTILGLVGENGAGKSTTIKLIIDAMESDSGEVLVFDTPSVSKDFVNIKEDIGVVLDEPHFPEVLTPKHINNVLSEIYKNWDKETYFSLLERFKLPLTKKFSDFSRGMKMKLSIAVSLSHGAKLLILDEATSGLDPIVRDEILDIFNEFTRCEEHSILISSHIVSDLEKICDYIAFLHKGKLVLFDEKDEILQKYALIKLTKEQYLDLPKDAIISTKNENFGISALVLKDKINENFVTEHTTLEDVVLFMSKE